MTTREPECIVLKRRGAEYVAQLLSGKSKEEEQTFWAERTKRLRSGNRQMQSESGQGSSKRIPPSRELGSRTRV